MICVYHFNIIYFTPCDQGWEEDSNKDSNKKTVVLNNSNKLWTFSHPINRLHWSDPVEGQINITNINEPSQSNNNGLLSNNKQLGI